MNPTNYLKKMFSRKKAISNDTTDLLGWHPIGGSSTYNHWKSQSYDNTFPSITKIANQFMTVEPYATNAKGERVTGVTAVDKLYRPNQEMSAADFRECLAVMSLVHPEVNILVWTMQNKQATPGGLVTADNIAGYTFLEGAIRTVTNNKVSYTVNGNTYSENEVITLKSVNPYNLSTGFGPSQAVYRWTTIDDHMADYQRGFFENGAVPAGMFIIRTRTKTDYEDIVQKLQQKHRGASKNNNISYSHSPIDANGKAQEAQIEWVPFNVSNKDLALKDISEQINRRIDSAFGVPASIRGVNDNNTYASVRVDEQIFIKYSVKPLTMKIWNKFTHELNRIVINNTGGGIGAAISFDMSIPGVADEEKIVAETKQVESSMITTMVEKGYSLESIVEAFGLDKKYSKLEISETTVPVEEDNPDVIETDENVELPDASIVQPLTRSVQKKLTDEQRNTYENRIEDIQRRQMEKQVNRAASDVSKDVEDATEEDIDEYITEMLAIAIPLMISEGALQYQLGEQLLSSADVEFNATSFFVSPTQIEHYRKYLKKVGLSYAAETALSIREVLSRSQEQGLTKAQIANQLQDVMKTDEWRVKRIATTEVNRVQSQASIYAMEQIQDEAEVKIYKVWNNSSSDPCPYCESMNGREVSVEHTFLEEGGELTGTDGSTMVNNFVDMDVTSAHSNCHCYATFKVAR